MRLRSGNDRWPQPYRDHYLVWREIVIAATPAITQTRRIEAAMVSSSASMKRGTRRSRSGSPRVHTASCTYEARIGRIVNEHAHLISVIAHQPMGCAKPEESLIVLQNPCDGTRRCLERDVRESDVCAVNHGYPKRLGWLGSGANH